MSRGSLKLMMVAGRSLRRRWAEQLLRGWGQMQNQLRFSLACFLSNAAIVNIPTPEWVLTACASLPNSAHD